MTHRVIESGGSNLYIYSTFGTEFHFIDPAGNPVSARVSGNLFTTSITVMRTAAAAGPGLWFCPPYIVSDLLAFGALVPLHYETPELESSRALPPSPAVKPQGSAYFSTCWSTGSPKSRFDATPDR
jgi:DNA-binding transcriptional LysR family regulator